MGAVLGRPGVPGPGESSELSCSHGPSMRELGPAASGNPVRLSRPYQRQSQRVCIAARPPPPRRALLPTCSQTANAFQSLRGWGSQSRAPPPSPCRPRSWHVCRPSPGACIPRSYLRPWAGGLPVVGEERGNRRHVFPRGLRTRALPPLAPLLHKTA